MHLIYRAKLINDIVNAGPNLGSAFFSWAEIPWNELAFPSVHWALNHYKEVEELVEFSPRSEGKLHKRYKCIGFQKFHLATEVYMSPSVHFLVTNDDSIDA